LVWFGLEPFLVCAQICWSGFGLGAFFLSSVRAWPGFISFLPCSCVIFVAA
jgi:hypothetical protein